MKQLLAISLLAVCTLSLSVSPIQADFVQCPLGGGACIGSTVNADLINGSAQDDLVFADDGDDVVLGGDGSDGLAGGAGNDIIFGGLGNDGVNGGSGDDTLWAGPDIDANSEQVADGVDGNDGIIVFAGEIFGCLTILGESGVDVANLIGFGPYSAQAPFDQSGFVLVNDPITNGRIVIGVIDNGDLGIEAINGLPSPNLTIVNGLPDGCID